MSQQDATEHPRTYSDPIQSVVQELVDSISGSIRSQDFDAISSKTHLLYSLLELQERIQERHDISIPITDDIDGIHTDMDGIHEQMKDMKEELDRFLKRGSFWARMVPLFLVALAIVAYPLYGMVTHMAPQSLVQYLSPITGLAGAIIGYWFGRQGEGS